MWWMVRMTFRSPKWNVLLRTVGMIMISSMDALINYAQSSAGYDVCYILAAYSASMEQQNTSQADMISKLDGVSAVCFR